MKRKMMAFLLAQLLVFSFSIACFGASTLPPKKQTVLAKYVTAKQAYEKYSQDPANVKILDARTIGEYVFVGHAPMAVNIPLKFLDRGLTDKNKPVMPTNENFVSEVTKRFKKTDQILVMCRSGARSAACVNLLAKAGFNDVYTITDGFEGDKDDQGQRTVNGWKNSGVPWTFKLDPALVY
ncbi:rhodanese-like domain-containing protein [Desulfobacula phenolica]|uniref:Rhodanese-related sulfurtransferase n=1 Tax=Desulfobacula phenolica TaxID=90732 RepID=A0A1H2DZ36_9BACT|nr:rhodanese-like domain-containing protein [Desulfobacula phenolica]SDT88075.1 Rhodanese-related sulfurtransferase [Desulfobacula phenolica]